VSTPDPFVPLPDEWARRTVLRDGTDVLLRSIRPEDAERLVEGLRQLSPSSRYLRFHAAVESLSKEQIEYLTEVDHHDHEAIVALDLGRRDRPGVGVARYIREVYEPEVAEAAITVADAYQGQGAGTLLLGALAGRAREAGIEVFRNYVLDGNHAMLEVFDHLGAHRELETDGMWRVDLRVPASEDETTESPAGRAFLEIARQDRTLVSLFPPIWSRWRRRRGTDGGEVGEDEQGRSGPFREVMADELSELHDELDAWLQGRDER
jgi:GNAT superfamily N-acetyltransferase